MLGANGVVGGGYNLATGAALANKMVLKNDTVSVVFFGDGASNRGTFHAPFVLRAQKNSTHPSECCAKTRLSLGELGRAAGGFQAVLLALLHSGVAGQEPGGLQRGTISGVHHQKSSGDTVADGAGLAGHAAAADGGFHIDLVHHGLRHQREAGRRVSRGGAGADGDFVCPHPQGHGVVDLQAAFNIKRGGFEKWWVSLLLAVVTLLLGALIIIDPFAALDALLILIGLVLIFDGLSDLYIIFRISRVFREVKQAAADARQEAGAVETEGTVTDDDSAETDGASGKTE